MTGLRRAALLAGPALVLAAAFAAVKPTNFGGHDEWLVVDLVRHGIVGFPYARRPLALLWTWPGAALTPNGLAGYWLVHVFFLAAMGAAVAWLSRRWLRLPAGVALVAGVLAAAWAPRDQMRLDVVLVSRYSGCGASALAAMLLFVGGWRRFRRGRRGEALALGALSLAAAAVIPSGLEAALTLMAGAPLLAWASRPADVRRHRRAFAAAAAALGLALAAGALPFVLALRGQGTGYQYQSRAGIDLHPLRLGSRVLRQYAWHLLPVVTTSPRELVAPTVPIAVLAFAAAFAAAGTPAVRGRARLRATRRRLWRAAALGAALAGLGWLTLVATPLIDSAARTQVLSAPGVALLLASLCGLAATLVPPRACGAALAVLGAWIVAVAAGRTAAMQRDWDRNGYWAGQRGTLVQLTALAPALAPNTLVLLEDEAGAWRATFTFRHAVRVAYGDGVLGHVAGGIPFLYPARFERDGVHVDPFPSIREPWRAPPTVHGYDEIVAVRLRADGHLALLEQWPASLPPLPGGARYAPRARILSGLAPPPSRRILGAARWHDPAR